MLTRNRLVHPCRWPLWFLVILSGAGYVILARWFPLIPYYNVLPLADVRSLAPAVKDAALYALLLLALHGLYYLAYRQVRLRSDGLSLSRILLVAVIFSLPLLSAFPINATDIYRYFIRGRIASVYGQNPYSATADDLASDPFVPMAGEWSGETSPYGPLWELQAGLVTTLFPENLLAALITFKLIAAATLLLCALLLWHIIAGVDRSKRSALTILWAWNPALLLIFAVNGHNDGWMMLWLLLGYWLAARSRVQLGMIVMLLSPLSKPVGLLALPFFFLEFWRGRPTFSQRIRFLLITAFAAAVLIMLVFIPFGSPFDLGRRLLSEAGSGGGFSPLALTFLELRNSGHSPSIASATRVAFVLLAVTGVILLWYTWRGRSSLRAAADIFFAYIIQAFRFRIWYAAWPIPWLILDKGQETGRSAGNKARLAAGLAFLLTSQFSVLVHGQLRIELLGESHLRGHRLGVPLTFVVPLVVGLAVYAYNARLREPQKEK